MIQGGSVSTALDVVDVVENTNRHHAHFDTVAGESWGCEELRFGDDGEEDILRMSIASLRREAS